MNKKFEIKEVKEFIEIKNLSKETNLDFNLYTFKDLDNSQDLSEEWKLFLYKKYKNKYLEAAFSQINSDTAEAIKNDNKKIEALNKEKNKLNKAYKKNVKIFTRAKNEIALYSLVDEFDYETLKLDKKILEEKENLLNKVKKAEEIKKSFIKITEAEENTF